MIREPQTFRALSEQIRRFVNERLIPSEARLADAETGELVEGRTAEIEMPAYSVRIFRMERG